MQVIKIIKYFRGGKSENYIVVNSNDEEFIKDTVEDWCDKDSGGKSSGFNAEWETVTDIDKIKQVIEKEIKLISDKIKNYEEYKLQLQQLI